MSAITNVILCHLYSLTHSHTHAPQTHTHTQTHKHTHNAHSASMGSALEIHAARTAARCTCVFVKFYHLSRAPPSSFSTPLNHVSSLSISLSLSLSLSPLSLALSLIYVPVYLYLSPSLSPSLFLSAVGLLHHKHTISRPHTHKTKHALGWRNCREIVERCW